MSVSKGFLAHALDLLSGIGEVTSRPMFGGRGVYLGGQIFGLIVDEDLFLKTDAQTVQRFEEAGCRAFIYAGPRGPTKTSYRRPPDEAFEHAEAMLPWALLSLEAARRIAEGKAGRAKRSPARPGRRIR